VTTYDIHLGLIRKRVVDFLKVPISVKQRGWFDPKLQVEEIASHQSFLHG